MKGFKVHLLLMVVFSAFALMLTGCGGGGDDGGGVGSATITGTVSGTVIVAIDQNNNEVTRGKATGTPKRFTITVPIGSTYRLYLIENEDTSYEKIFPLYQGEINKFSIASAVTIDLGSVNIDTSKGVAQPTINPLDVSGVSSAGKDTSIPEILISPTSLSLRGAGLSFLVSSGLDALSKGTVLKAKAYFKAAVENYPDDTARFFYALTRVAGVKLYSDGNPEDMNSAGDILDRLGVGPGGRNPMAMDLDPPDTLPSGSPTGADIQAFLYNVIRPEMEGAIDNLKAISPSFNETWKEPLSGKHYESDYGDVLFFRALIKGALANILIQHAYNLNMNIARNVNNKSLTTERFLGDNLSFLTMATDYSTSLSDAKSYLSGAADDLIAAIAAIRGEGDDQTNDLINLREVTEGEIAEAKTALATWKSSLSSPTTVDNGEDKKLGTPDDIIINLNPFFAGLSLRDLLPPFTGEDPSGMFPDATMGGVIVQGINPNEDLNKNGIPDILE